MTRAELKSFAKERMALSQPHYALTALIVILASGAVSAIGYVGGKFLFPFGTLISLCASFASILISVGFSWFCLGLVRGKSDLKGEYIKLGDNWIALLLAEFLTGLFIALWSLLLFVPGIIAALRYSMTFYILRDKPTLSAYEAMKESSRLTDGHKMDIFILTLSFIPWTLLTAVTFGIAGLYTMPYMSTTYAAYYDSLVGGSAGKANPAGGTGFDGYTAS